MNTSLPQSPMLGVGIGLRREFHDSILETRRTIDWLEVVSENFMGMHGRPRFVLDGCRERWPIVPHGVAASVGSSRGGDRDAYDTALADLVDRLSPPFFSDHLCYSSRGGHESFDLLPLPLIEEAVEAVSQRCRQLVSRIGRPLLLENITCYAAMPGAEMSESEFLSRVLDASGCGLLLDLNNLYLNARNHGREPLELLDGIPLDQVRQIHLAGYSMDGEVMLDTHSTPVSAAVWALYRETLRRIGPVSTLIEWDQGIPSLDAVLDEADRAREILRSFA